MNKLILMRGLPGSGKSTIARAIGDNYGSVICSADDHFMVDGEYIFDATQLGAAHKECQDLCRLYMREGRAIIVVDNTNTTWKECEPYVRMANHNKYEVQYIMPKNEWSFDVNECFRRTTHGVPLEAIQRMFDRFANASDLLLQMYKKYDVVASCTLLSIDDMEKMNAVFLT